VGFSRCASKEPAILTTNLRLYLRRVRGLGCLAASDRGCLLDDLAGETLPKNHWICCRHRLAPWPGRGWFLLVNMSYEHNQVWLVKTITFACTCRHCLLTPSPDIITVLLFVSMCKWCFINQSVIHHHPLRGAGDGTGIAERDVARVRL
jgi:hypothetical protein